MSSEKFVFKSKLPKLDLHEGPEMLKDFSREAQRHLISARNALLVLEMVPTDKEAIENVFKTFHTISGLADFLKLHDIYWITKASERMMDLVRKNVLPCDDRVYNLTLDSLKRLQELFELLDEQISGQGQLKIPYPDQTQLVKNLHEIASHPEAKASEPKKPHPPEKDIPKISVDDEHKFFDQLKERIQSVEGNIVLRKEPLERLLDDFKKLDDQLKNAQGKVQERQKELIKERELALKLTQQAQGEARAKSDYLANMSHEIRTLINAILGFTDLIKEDLPKNSKQIEHLNTIIVSGKMLLEIVNNILDFSKVEAGKLKLEEIPFNLREIAEDVFQVVRARLDSKPINLYINIEPNVPVSLMGDPTRLKQIFMNLLDNAIKFTKKGEIGLSVRLGRQQGKLNQPALFFTIKDTGIGIPEDRKNMVFDSFIQADASTTRLYGGTGLGLALCKAFVEAMKGSIWIDSELGAGSEFNFVIQFKKAKEPVEIEAVQYNGAEKVLVVTPFDKTVDMFQYVFDHLSLTPLSICRNIKHACEVLTSLNRPPDVIFVDTLLEDDQGVKFAKDVRNQDIYQLSKLVAISSDIKYFEKFSIQGSPFDAIVFTPIILREVADVVKSLGSSADEDEDVETSKSVPQEGSGVQFNRVRILVVEDSIPNQELLRVHFEDLGCYCDYASNGKKALECLKRLSYDICFMDLQMPEMGGLEAAEIIRKEMKLDIPIIALTAAEVSEEREECLRSGMNDYLSKPFDVTQLKEKLKKFVTKKTG